MAGSQANTAAQDGRVRGARQPRSLPSRLSGKTRPRRNPRQISASSRAVAAVCGREDERAVDRAGRGADDQVRGHAALVQRAQHPNLDRAEAATSGEHERDGAGMRTHNHSACRGRGPYTASPATALPRAVSKRRGAGDTKKRRPATTPQEGGIMSVARSEPPPTSRLGCATRSSASRATPPTRPTRCCA
jgi:hypothetical protein